MLKGWNRKVRMTSAMMQRVDDHADGFANAAFFPSLPLMSRSSASRPLGAARPAAPPSGDPVH